MNRRTLFATALVGITLTATTTAYATHRFSDVPDDHLSPNLIPVPTP